jgi:hypothetical protein
MGHPGLVEGTEFLTDFTRFPPDLKAIQGERNRAQFPEALRGSENPNSKLSAVGTGRIAYLYPGLSSWAKFRRPFGTRFIQ